jgi:uncharacterized protein (TIGR02145 family)
MKLRNILYYLATIVLFTSQLWANTNPVVTNVAFGISGTTVTVTYDVTDAEESTLTISMEVSSNNGTTWDYNYGTATGAIGTGVAKGTGKTITWTYSGGYNDQFVIKIIADDLVGDQIYYAGKIYNTVTIGSQVWLKENLDVGTMINSTTGGTGSDGIQSNNSTIEKYCYNNTSNNCDTYGGLYRWDEAMQYVTTDGAKGICPTSWHIPTIVELTTLATTESNSSTALRALGQGAGSGAGTNSSGFSAMLGGACSPSGGFSLGAGDFNGMSSFQSSTMYDGTNSYRQYALGYNNTIYTDHVLKTYGYSVRCLKN